ncbi:undecaprenyl-phosphate alpha-N-acetylglucosaminyl 1-phosphate transferase [Spirochaetia bacterium]|nr:undecaprenyl-phosphate alpha-N-acetylglucosaminyl 1-phosphate transferase [Spirochaetia bacterium]
MVGSGCIIILSFFLSLVAVWVTLKISRRMSWYDPIDERKIHTGDIPRLGGAGFASAFIIIAFIINFLAVEPNFGWRFLPPLIAIILVLASGVYDDFRSIAPRYKLLIQAIAAFCVVIPGYTFHRLFFIDIGPLSELNWVRYPLTFLWIVGLTNAINFIDGVDGLAGSISLLIALTFALIFASAGGSFAENSVAARSTVLLCICLAAVICGFLIFNAPFPRAKIFMGDGGSQFLGFTLALLPLMESNAAYGDAAGWQTPIDLPVPYAAAILLIPTFDAFAAIWRRLRDGRRIDSPDKFHIHHKLLNLGLTPRRLDVVLCSLQIVLSVLVYVSVKTEGRLSLLVLLIAYLVGICFFTIIHFMNRALELKNKTASAAVSQGR